MSQARRTDIDTLRGVSVISVLIYHLNSSFFPNGYLGVDLFFVISGYVITRSIIKDLQNGKFNFLNFYIKRARRILPALLFVLLTSLLFAGIFLLNADLKRFVESLVSSLGFVSNFYFWLTGGYFSSNDQLKPLLHLWSLSVEEQFYIFFPIFLFLIYRFFKNKNAYFIGILLASIISFTLNYYFLSHTDTVFFLFPTRIWQFGIGAAAALSPHLKIKNLWAEFFYYFIAIFLIVYNFCVTTKSLPDGTLMCIGLSLILIKYSNEKNFLSKIFQFRPIIFTGLISYSLYLWHWPTISFLKYIFVDGLTKQIIFLTIIFIFTISFLSWKFIEQPFLSRQSNIYKYNYLRLFKLITLKYFLLIFISLTIIFSKNFPSRYEKLPNLLAQSIRSSYDCPPIKYRKFNETFGCYINIKKDSSPNYILFGNSHAYMYGWPLIEHLKKINENGIILQFSCQPFIDKNSSKACLKKAKIRFQSILKTKNNEKVFIGLTWNSKRLVNEKGEIFMDTDFKYRKKSIDNLINQLQKNNKEVYLFGPIQSPNYDFASEYSRQIIFKGKKYDNKKPKEEFENNYRSIINYYERKLGSKFIKPHKKFCDENYCYFSDDKGAFFSDNSHLSKYGSMKMLTIFDNID